MAVLFLIFLDQICPKWIKLDQTWSNWISRQSKNVTIKSCHIYKKDNNGRSVFDFCGSDLSKMDQTWSKWISHKSKSVSIDSFHIYKKNKNGCFIFYFWIRSSKLDQTWSNLIKLDQTWSNLIKLDFSPIKKCYYKKLSHLQKG